MNRDAFVTLVLAWFRGRGIALAEINAVEFGGATAPADAIVPLTDEAALEELRQLTYLLDDVKRTRTPTPRRTPTPPRVAIPVAMPRTVTPSRTETTQIPPDILAAAIAASRDP